MQRSFIFLQGHVGPFFKILGRSLIKEGHRVVRVNFNGGDILDWAGPETIVLRAKAKEWPDYLLELIQKNRTTDLVTYGDCRPQLRVASKLARAVGVRCHVFEMGYIRPDFITLEDSGVNGNSLLPKSPEWYLDLARSLPDETPIKPARYPMSALVRHSVPYNLVKFAAQSFFSCFKNHRPFKERTAVSRWTRKILQSRRQFMRDQQFQREFLSVKRNFFLFCLQLESDYQIRFHSPFGDIKSAINYVLTSFSESLPVEGDLLVKCHPEELFPLELERFTFGLANRLGIAERVYFTTGGNLEDYIVASRGMVTVNSTAGMASLDHNRPTIALGKAVYKIPGLIHGRLESFWKDPVPPDDNLYRAFRKVLIHKTLINGNFFTEEGIKLAVPKAVKRLTGNGDSPVF